MKRIFYTLLLTMNLPVYACDLQYERLAMTVGMKGANCGIADHLYDLYQTLGDAESLGGELVQYDIDNFMQKLLIADIDGEDGDLAALSVVGSVTFYGMMYQREGFLQIAVKGFTAPQQGYPIAEGAFKPLGFGEFKMANGFTKQIMVIEPYNPPAKK